MMLSIVLSENWDEICTPRMGVAQLTQMAFERKDMRRLWHELMDKATDDAAGSGMGMDLSVIAQLLGDKPTGLAIQNEMLALQRLYRSPSAAGRPGLRLLALAAVMDIGGNTPLEFLLQVPAFVDTQGQSREFRQYRVLDYFLTQASCRARVDMATVINEAFGGFADQ